MYWCSTATAGIRAPTSLPTSRPHMPAALTTISHSIAMPSAVWTEVTRRPSTVIDSTLVFSRNSAPRARAPRAIACVTEAGSMYPSVGRKAAATTSSLDMSGNSSWARCGETSSIGRPKLFAIVVSRFSSITRSAEQASRRLPVSRQSTAWPVSASRPRYISTDCSSIRVVLRDDRSWPTSPAACHVAPSVSRCCSRTSTSASPIFVNQ